MKFQALCYCTYNTLQQLFLNRVEQKVSVSMFSSFNIATWRKSIRFDTFYTSPFWFSFQKNKLHERQQEKPEIQTQGGFMYIFSCCLCFGNMISTLSLISNYSCVCNLPSPCYALSLPYGSEFNELIHKVSSQSMVLGITGKIQL